MTTASLELCKELYELSGWIDRKELRLDYVVNKGELPRYDLGYLLDKLPYYVHVWKSNTTQKLGTAEVYYPADIRQKVGTISHDTPVDAVCALAIELFKQGVLKP